MPSTDASRHCQDHRGIVVLWAVVTLGFAVISLSVGSEGWEPWWRLPASSQAMVLGEIRLPRLLGGWGAGAALGLAGAVAQGVFRNPLADPYLLGSSSGAALALAALLAAAGFSPAAAGWLTTLGFTGAAFLGALAAVLLTLLLAQGAREPLRLLLAGVIVGMVLGALNAFLMLRSPEIFRTLQGFMLGSTAFINWAGAGMLLAAVAIAGMGSIAGARALDALSLGESTAASLGVSVGRWRMWLIACFALATGAAVSQVGLVAFIGLVAPHLVRSALHPLHRGLIVYSAIVGGTLLVAADVLARALAAPEELPVGVLTAMLGGGYLLWLMYRRRA